MEDLLQKLAPGVDIEAELVRQAAESSSSSPAATSPDDKERNRTTGKGSSAAAHEVTLMRDYAQSKQFDTCKPVQDYDNVDYETSDDELGPNQLPDIITDAMQDLSLSEHAVSRFHGKSSSLMLVRAASDLKKQHGLDASETRRAEFWTPADWEWELMSDPAPPPSVVFPPDDLIATLFELFFRHFTPFLPIIHQPTFEAQFKDGVHRRNTSFAIVVLLVCAVASRYCNDPRVCLKDGGRPSAGWKYFVQVKDLRRSLHAPAKLSDLQTYALVAHYLQATSAPHSAWTVIGIGIRCAQDIGIHRKKIYKGSMTLQDEQWKRVFWCLITLDRYVSSALGRPLACQDEDFDIDFPEEIDDEYWVTTNEQGNLAAVQFPKQPEGVPSKISYFVAYLKLGQILAFALRTIYTINKSKVLLGFVGEQWEQHIVAELDSAMNKWLDAVPDHLRWDPNRENQMYFEQSAVLYAAYYHLHIMIHRPFIPSPKKPSVLSFPSLTICTNAARSCSHVIDAYSKRSTHVPPSTLVAAFTSGVVLLIAIWGAKKAGLSVDNKTHMNDVEKCLNFLAQSEKDWHYSGRLVDILRELATFGDVPEIESPSTSSHKRDRDDGTNSIPTPPSSDGRTTEDESSRPRKPMPRPRTSNPSATQLPSPPNPSYIPMSGSTPPRGAPMVGPTGGVLSPQTSQSSHLQKGFTASDFSNPAIASSLGASFFDPATFASTSSGAGSSNQASMMNGANGGTGGFASGGLPLWDGILASSQQNPFGAGVGSSGMMSSDPFNPLFGYQGPGGPLGFAAEAQAFLGTDLDWPDGLGLGNFPDWTGGDSQIPNPEGQPSGSYGGMPPPPPGSWGM